MYTVQNSYFSGSPKKKRSKVTDSVRGPRSSLSVRDSAYSLPTSERSTPQPASVATGAYFPPTMVAHPLFNGAYRPENQLKRSHSPDAAGSDDASDFDMDTMGSMLPSRGPRGSMHGQLVSDFHMTNLTPIHLRKAKLM